MKKIVITKEKTLYQHLKKAWGRKYISRIEPKYDGGIPDCLLVHNEKPFFIELKVATLIYTRDKRKVKIDVRPSQRIWHKKYEGKSYLLAFLDGWFYLFNREDIINLRRGMEFEAFDKLSHRKGFKLSPIISFLQSEFS